MAHAYDAYPAGPSYSTRASAGWPAYDYQSYDYPNSYEMYASGAYGESASTCQNSAPAPYSPCYGSPDALSFDEYEVSTPISPSSSASSSSSDAPVTPSYQQPGLPAVGLLYTRFDPPIEEEDEEFHSVALDDATDACASCEGWEEEQTYCAVLHESRQYDNTSALWAGHAAAHVGPYHASGASPYASAPLSPTEILAASSETASPTNTHTQIHEYPTASPVSCLSPALLSCPPPLKLHQPQPRRSIPVISLSALASDSDAASASASVVAHNAPPPIPGPYVASPLSPLELQLSSPHDGRVMNYAALSSPAVAYAYASAYQPHCSCSDCMRPAPYGVSIGLS